MHCVADTELHSQWSEASTKHLKPAFFLKTNRVRLYWALRKNDNTSHLIYDLSKPFSQEFMVSALKSFSIQHDVHLVNDNSIKNKMIKQGML